MAVLRVYKKFKFLGETSPDMLGFCHVKEKMVKNKNKSNNSHSGFMLHGRASQGTLS